MTNLLPYAIAWGVLVLVVIGLAVMRKSVAKKEDDFVHLSGDMSVVANQTEVASKLEAIDKWGKCSRSSQSSPERFLLLCMRSSFGKPVPRRACGSRRRGQGAGFQWLRVR